MAHDLACAQGSWLSLVHRGGRGSEYQLWSPTKPGFHSCSGCNHCTHSTCDLCVSYSLEHQFTYLLNRENSSHLKSVLKGDALSRAPGMLSALNKWLLWILLLFPQPLPQTPMHSLGGRVALVGKSRTMVPSGHLSQCSPNPKHSLSHMHIH